MHVSAPAGPWLRPPVARRLLPIALLALGVAAPLAAGPASLRTSSITEQNREARRHDYTFLRTPADVRHFVRRGYLVRLEGNRDYWLKGVSYPYARPEVKLFVERLAGQYRAACGEPLVVTSLTRPRTRQPRNASPNSVHPTGMALDLRRSNRSSCRKWLERVLLSLESRGVLEAGYERRPPHYHVALFPRQYVSYLARLGDRSEEYLRTDRHIVARGDTLWKIASRFATTVETVKRANGLRSNRIYPGQVLRVPAGP